jgi:hypothetical protein
VPDNRLPIDGNCVCIAIDLLTEVRMHSSCSNKDGAELVPISTHHSSTSTHYNGTLFPQPASAIFTISSTEACYDEQLGDGGSRRVRGKSASSSLLTNGSDQQIPSNNLFVKWESLPHHALLEIMNQVRWERPHLARSGACAKGDGRRMTVWFQG